LHGAAQRPANEVFAIVRLLKRLRHTHAVVVFDPPNGSPSWRRALWPEQLIADAATFGIDRPEESPEAPKV